MATSQDRAKHIHKMAEDPLIPFPDKIVTITLWVRYEYALLRRQRISRRIDKLSDRLMAKMDLFNFIHELDDL